MSTYGSQVYGVRDISPTETGYSGTDGGRFLIRLVVMSKYYPMVPHSDVTFVL